MTMTRPIKHIPVTKNRGVNMNNNHKYNKNISMLAGAFLLLVLGGLFAYAATVIWTSSGTGFLAGTFNNTLYNSTGGYVHLNWSDATNTTYRTSGTYLSEVKDLGGTSRILNLSWRGKPGTCPANMSYIDKLGGFCIDQYEASVPGQCSNVGTNCAMTGWAGYCAGSCVPDSGSFGDTAGTGTTANATSRPNVAPLASISQNQAKKLCTNAGKHLCTSKEWLAAANLLGRIYNLPTGASGAYMPNGNSDTAANCNTNSFCTVNASTASNRVCLSGSRTDCHSQEGVYDMVGNVWEWTNETVDVTNPGGGANWYYINTTNGNWSLSSAADNGKYGLDGTYFPVTTTGRAVPRGGLWFSAGNAGLFSVYLDNAPTFVVNNIGFRCCQAPV